MDHRHRHARARRGRGAAEAGQAKPAPAWRRQSRWRAADDRPAARLADLAPALLGSTDPDHPLRRVRSRAGAGRGSAGPPARSRGLPPRGHRPVAARRRPDWLEVPCPDCGSPAERETDVSDNFVDSSWYFLRYPSSECEDRPWDSARTAKALPVDFYAGGPEHVQRHHLYARFVTMALFDLGLVGFEEPFPCVRLGGFIVYGGAKMSKSRGNVVTPDEFLHRHGADVLRCALLFSAPWEDGGGFRLESIAGIERFFAKLWRLFAGGGGQATAEAARRASHARPAPARARRGGGDREAAFQRRAGTADGLPAPTVRRRRIQLLHPLAGPVRAPPRRGARGRAGLPFSVHTAEWPCYDPAVIGGIEAVWVVQVDGKVRGHLRLPARASETEVVGAAMSSRRVATSLGGRAARRVVFVPGRLVNFVTEGSEPSPRCYRRGRSSPGVPFSMRTKDE